MRVSCSREDRPDISECLKALACRIHWIHETNEVDSRPEHPGRFKFCWRLDHERVNVWYHGPVWITYHQTFELIRGKLSIMRRWRPRSSLLRHWNVGVKIKVYTDSLAVLGTAKPTSELDYMRSFVIVSSGCWKLKVSTQSNLADVSTKPMAWETPPKHMQAMHFEIVEGRARSANGLRFAPSALMSALWQKDAAVQERRTNVQFFARRCVHVSTCDANCCLAPVK